MNQFRLVLLGLFGFIVLTAGAHGIAQEDLRTAQSVGNNNAARYVDQYGRVVEYSSTPPSCCERRPVATSRSNRCSTYDGSGAGRAYGLPRGRRYYNGRYFGTFHSRYDGPQYGYF
jgi:hypothetical protein